VGAVARGALQDSWIGEYRLVDFLGAGGMGEVYRAVHSKIGRVAAVKVLSHVGSSPSVIQRFLNEARIQASLHHPNVVTLYDFLEFNGQPCIIMEYIDGQTVDERVKAMGALQLSEAVYIFQAVVSALKYVHSHGVIHRDIKSNNIRISTTGEVKLLDFGIAKAESTPKLTTDGGVIGTLHYLSPEQLKGGNADARSDIWALGVLLYEMVTGRVPFDSTTLGDLYEKISKASYTPASTLNSSVPREVEQIIARCLKKKAPDRYQSVEELARDVARLTDRVAPARPTGTTRTMTSSNLGFGWVGQNWRLLSIAAVVVLVIVVGLFALMSIDPSGPPVVDPPAPVDQLKPVRLDTTEGPAEIWRGDQMIGKAPCEIKFRRGESVQLVIKKDGYKEKTVGFTVGEHTNQYTFSLEKR
jgi:serine/threonine-protein kinase